MKKRYNEAYCILKHRRVCKLLNIGIPVDEIMLMESLCRKAVLQIMAVNDEFKRQEKLIKI